MKNFTFKSIFTVLALMLALTSYSQDRCGMLEYMEEQLKDPEFARQHEEKQNRIKAQVQEFLNNGDYLERGAATIEIPVAVHFPTGNVADRACLEALAQNQIDILNADYTATNSDFTDWSNSAVGLFPNTNAGIANIQFCIATSNHPTLAQHGDVNLVEGNPAITVGVEFGGGSNNDSDWAGYLNFVVRNIGALGFSPLFGNVSQGYAVTMDNNAFASGPGCPASGVVPQGPYNLGRTTTHELGHFFGLEHTFNGDGNGSCGAGGDGLADTPEVANSSYGCPGLGSVASCVNGQSALTMNYMDYVNDACMYMFTEDQIALAMTYITNTLQADFKQNTCVAATPGFSLAAVNSPVSSCPDTDMAVDFDLTYTTILDFNETTTFTATGQPAGSTVSFSPTSLNNDGAFTMTVGNIGATAQGTYMITVTGTSNSVTETVDVVLNNNCTEIICTPYASSQNLNIGITDGSGGTAGTPLLQHVINVPDAGLIESMTVNVDVSHTWVSDLLVRIVHPDQATFIDVWSGNCAGGQIDFDITFDDEAGTIVCGGVGNPTNGTFAPGEPLSTFDGLEGQGDWTIIIGDFFSGDTGMLNDWTLTICTEQPLSVNEFSQDSFAIFPNPNNGEFTIKLNSNSGNDIEVGVFDIRGRKIFNNNYTNTGDFNETVNLNNVQSGMYLVTVNDGNNKITKRIIVD